LAQVVERVEAAQHHQPTSRNADDTTEWMGMVRSDDRLSVNKCRVISVSGDHGIVSDGVVCFHQWLQQPDREDAEDLSKTATY
jgi:hypothetical protein